MDRFLYTSVVVPTLPCAAVPTVSGPPEAGAAQNPSGASLHWCGFRAVAPGQSDLSEPQPCFRPGRWKRKAESSRALTARLLGRVRVSEAVSLGVRGQGSSHARGELGQTRTKPGSERPRCPARCRQRTAGSTPQPLCFHFSVLQTLLRNKQKQMPGIIVELSTCLNSK